MTRTAGRPPGNRRAELCSVALAVLEDNGMEGLSLGEVARRSGIRTPSLYKHFTDKADLELALVEQGLREFAEAARSALAAAGPSRRERLEAFATMYRRTALEAPQLYRLMNDRPLARDKLPAGLEESAMADLMMLVPDLDLARTGWAWAHGLVSLELAGRFPPDADLDEAWRILVDVLTDRS